MLKWEERRTHVILDASGGVRAKKKRSREGRGHEPPSSWTNYINKEKENASS